MWLWLCSLNCCLLRHMWTLHSDWCVAGSRGSMSGQRSSLRGRGRLCSLSQNQGGVSFPPCVSRLPPSPTSPVLFPCAALDLPFTPHQSTTTPDLSAVMGWFSSLWSKDNFQLKAIMGSDLLRLLPDIFLLCTGSLESLDVLRVSRRYRGSSSG